MYGCSPEDMGAKIRIEVDDQRVEATLCHSHDPMPVGGRSRGRKQVWTSGPVPVMTWVPLSFEPIALEKGQSRLVVRTVDLPAEATFELKEARVRRVD